MINNQPDKDFYKPHQQNIYDKYGNSTNALDVDMYNRVNNPYNVYQDGSNAPRDSIPTIPPPIETYKRPVPIISYIKCYKITISIGIIWTVLGLISFLWITSIIVISKVQIIPHFNTSLMLYPILVCTLILWGVSIYLYCWLFKRWSNHFSLVSILVVLIFLLIFVSGIILLVRVRDFRNEKPELFKPGQMIVAFVDK